MLKNLKISTWIPVAFIVILFGAIYCFAHFNPVSWDNMHILHMHLTQFLNAHSVLAPLLFIVFYTFYTAFALPGVIVLSVLAGCIFKQPFSFFYVLIAATMGGSLLFLMARTAFGYFLLKKDRPLLDRLSKGFHEDPIHYLLFLRLTPLFPFWFVNMAAAFFHVPFSTFVWTTLIGIAPAVFFNTQAGHGLGVLLESPDPITPKVLFNPHLTTALIGLGFLALLPLLLKKFKVRT